MRSLEIAGLRWALLCAALTVLLTACTSPVVPPLPPEKPEITLRASTLSLSADGGVVTLTVDVTKGDPGSVTSVTFKGNGATLKTVTNPESNGDFIHQLTITETTTFTADAMSADGSITSKPDGGVTVTVNGNPPVDGPKAPSSSAALKGFKDISLVAGTATGLAVVVTDVPGVTGQIDGDVQAATLKSSLGADVTVQAGSNTLAFSYKSDKAGLDSFEYTVAKNGEEAKGKIDLNIVALPSDVELIDGSDDIAAINASSKSKVLLAKDVSCNTDPCVTLHANQTLAGTMTIDGITITNSAKPKIIANIPGTRKSGTGACDKADQLEADNGGVFPPGEYDPRPDYCKETKVLVLADDTTVEGIEITSTSTDEGSSYFIAIFGRGDDPNGPSSVLLDGNIKIKDVTINRSNGKPIYIKYTYADDGSPSPTPTFTFGNYNLEIDGLDLNDANDTLVIGNPRTLVFKNSTIELLQPEGNNAGPQPFGDNSGVQIANYIDGDITIDNVDVFMESTKYRIDFLPSNNNCTPIEIFNNDFFNAAVTTNLTVKNSDITFGEVLSSGTRSFKVESNGGTINITDSTNNKSVQDEFDPVQVDGGVVNGEIEITP